MSNAMNQQQRGLVPFIRQIAARAWAYFFRKPVGLRDVQVEQPAPVASAPSFPSPEVEPVCSQKRPRRVKGGGVSASRTATLGALLDDLGETFHAFSMPANPLLSDRVSKDTRIGLRKLGVYVPLNEAYAWKATVPVDKGFPALMGVSFPNKASELTAQIEPTRKEMLEDKRLPPRFAFAVKHTKPPAGVERKAGVLYEFIMSHDADFGKLSWKSAWIVVDPVSGSIATCDEYRPEIRKVATRVSGRVRTVSYVDRRWRPASLIEILMHENSDHRDTTPEAFGWMFQAWMARLERWSVSVTKHGNRVVFGIPANDAKAFFVDREKVAVVGKRSTKRIVHFVAEHRRERADGKVVTVREHLRGLRSFVWKGYGCVVTAPEFHGLASVSFGLAGASFLDEHDEEQPAEPMVFLSKVGLSVGSLEDAVIARASHSGVSSRTAH